MNESNREYEANLYYEKGQYDSARQIYEELLKGSGDSTEREKYRFNVSTCLAAEGQYEKALESFNKSSNVESIYNGSLCLYHQFKYQEAIEQVDRLLDSSQPPRDLIEISQANSSWLEESLYLRAINLKVAILMKLNSPLANIQHLFSQASTSGTVGLRDYITHHNIAVYETDVKSATDKLIQVIDSLKTNDEAELVSKVSRNLLLLYLNSNQYEAARELLTSKKDELARSLTSEELIFYQIISETDTNSNDSSVLKLEMLVEDQLKKSQVVNSEPSFEQMNVDFIENLVTFLGSVLWKRNSYRALEVLLMKVEAVLGKSDLWKKSLANCLYMQDIRFEECCQLYEDLLPHSASESLLDVDSNVLSNLCISYVLTGRNSDAELLIKDLETLESNGSTDAYLPLTQCSTKADQPPLLSTVNLAIGTLYCVKYNYDFGITRIMKTLEPLEKFLVAETWSIAKRCILAMLDLHCKQMICLKDELLNQVINFLIRCERFGIQVDATPQALKVLGQKSRDPEATVLPAGYDSVTYEARYLRSILLTLIHD